MTSFLYRLYIFSVHPTDVTRVNVVWPSQAPLRPTLDCLACDSSGSTCFFFFFVLFFLVIRVTCENTQNLSGTFNPLRQGSSFSLPHMHSLTRRCGESVRIYILKDLAGDLICALLSGVSCDGSWWWRRGRRSHDASVTALTTCFVSPTETETWEVFPFF